MKPETQVKIARRTSFVWFFLYMLYPLGYMYDKVYIGAWSPTLKQAVMWFAMMYLFPAVPLAMLFWGYAWALKRRKRRTATVLFVLTALQAVSSVIKGGMFMLVIGIVTVVLLLQGILGISKLPPVSPQKPSVPDSGTEHADP